MDFLPNTLIQYKYKDYKNCTVTPWIDTVLYIYNIYICIYIYISFPSSGDLPDPGVEPGSPALQVDSLPSKP